MQKRKTRTMLSDDHERLLPVRNTLARSATQRNFIFGDTPTGYPVRRSAHGVLAVPGTEIDRRRRLPALPAPHLGELEGVLGRLRIPARLCSAANRRLTSHGGIQGLPAAFTSITAAEVVHE
jgi:hypothetical protein